MTVNNHIPDSESRQSSVKCCLVCKQEFPATTEYFHRQGKYLHPKCKTCANEAARQVRIAHPERHRESVRKYRASHREEIREYAQKYNADHREQNRKYAREYRETHREEKRQYRVANREKNRQYAKKSNAKRSEKIREYRRQWNLVHSKEQDDYRRKYQLAHPELMRQRQAKRRSQKRNLPTNFTETDWMSALAYFDGFCAYCGNPPGLLRNMRFHQDHYIPASDPRPDNPGYVASNILPACGACNCSKGHRAPHEWLIEHFGARKAKKIESRIAAYFASLKGEK